MTTAMFKHRPPDAWAEDLVWHRHMFKQSRFRWISEDAIQIAMHYGGGNTEFTTPAHLRRLDRALQRLSTYTEQIRNAIAWELEQARPHFDADAWRECLTLMDFTGSDDAFMHWITQATDPADRGNDQTQRILRGVPIANPLTNAWEIRQLRALWEAGCDLLEDCVCDLLEELSPSRGLRSLVGLTSEINVSELQNRIDLNVEMRGRVGDPRRVCAQRYPEPVAPPRITKLHKQLSR